MPPGNDRSLSRLRGSGSGISHPHPKASTGAQDAGETQTSQRTKMRETSSLVLRTLRKIGETRELSQ